MLPHEISSKIASLVPNEDRLCLGVDVDLAVDRDVDRVLQHRQLVRQELEVEALGHEADELRVAGGREGTGAELAGERLELEVARPHGDGQAEVGDLARICDDGQSRLREDELAVDDRARHRTDCRQVGHENPLHLANRKRLTFRFEVERESLGLDARVEIVAEVLHDAVDRAAARLARE